MAEKQQDTDAYTTYELSLDKVVEGNMGNKDQLFNFTTLKARQTHPLLLGDKKGI